MQVNKEFVWQKEPVCRVNLSIKGVKCDKADTCEDATEPCKSFVFALNTVKCLECGAVVGTNDRMICDPTKRWMYCHSWKQKLGMVFDKDLGIYILPEWKDELMKRAGK